MKKAIAGVLLITLSFLLKSCDTTEPPPPPNGTTIYNTINLSVEWTDLYRINVNWNRAKADTLEPFTYRLTQTDEQGNKTTKEFTIAGTDTNYTAGEPDSLQQGKTYWFNVEGYNSEGKLKDTSKTLNAKTLSPTSHDIAWEIDTLGQPGDFLYDVWGLDENNVYAVGAVTLPEGRSGVIKWDGEKWTPLPSFEGTKVGIFGFAEDDFWVVTGGTFGKVAHWNGSTWEEYSFYPPPVDTIWGLRSVWGSSPEDVWAVGLRGTIIHWDGVEWKKVTSIDSKFNLWDVWGFSSECIYTIGNQPNIQMAFYYYNGTQWNLIKTDASPGLRLSTTWGPFNDYVYVIDAQQYIYRYGNFETLIFPNRTSVINKIRGSGINNVVTVGAYSELFHFNGVSWERINQLYSYPEITSLHSCFVFDGKIFAVGYTNDRALVVIGTNH